MTPHETLLNARFTKDVSAFRVCDGMSNVMTHRALKIHVIDQGACIVKQFRVIRKTPINRHHFFFSLSLLFVSSSHRIGWWLQSSHLVGVRVLILSPLPFRLEMSTVSWTTEDRRLDTDDVASVSSGTIKPFVPVSLMEGKDTKAATTTRTLSIALAPPPSFPPPCPTLLVHLAPVRLPASIYCDVGQDRFTARWNAEYGIPLKNTFQMEKMECDGKECGPDRFTFSLRTTVFTSFAQLNDALLMTIPTPTTSRPLCWHFVETSLPLRVYASTWGAAASTDLLQFQPLCIEASTR